jgi:hypothetical protein
LLKYPVSKPRLLDKSRAVYRRERKRDPSLPPLSPAAGNVEVNDAIRVTLPTVGGKVVYTAVPVGGWRFEFEHQSYSRAAASAAPAVVPPAASFDAQMAAFGARFKQLKQMSDTVLNGLADLDRQVLAFEAKHLPRNVVHLSNIAAE